jgi:hypothetical protein
MHDRDASVNCNVRFGGAESVAVLTLAHLQHIVECISRTTARILANKHSKGSVFLRSFDRIYCINYTIFVHTQLSIY